MYVIEGVYRREHQHCGGCCSVTKAESLGLSPVFICLKWQGGELLAEKVTSARIALLR